MLITKRQLAMMEELNKERFTMSLERILERHYGDRPGTDSKSKRLECIKKGFEKSKSYKITNWRDVAKIIVLMAEFSLDFDDNPKYPWARALLNTDLSDRIDRMIKVAQIFLNTQAQQRREGSKI